MPPPPPPPVVASPQQSPDRHPNLPEPAHPPAAPPGPTAELWEVVNTSVGAQVRDGEGLGSRPGPRLPAGTVVTVVEHRGNRLRIHAVDHPQGGVTVQGWVSA
eukprot:gene2448-18495_t